MYAQLLRDRELAAAAGIPARVRTHDVTKQVEYIGNVQNLVEKLSDLPAGGQILMGALSYQRIYGRSAFCCQCTFQQAHTHKSSIL